jgi:hypothetical protein
MCVVCLVHEDKLTSWQQFDEHLKMTRWQELGTRQQEHKQFVGNHVLDELLSSECFGYVQRLLGHTQQSNSRFHLFLDQYVLLHGCIIV